VSRSGERVTAKAANALRVQSLQSLSCSRTTAGAITLQVAHLNHASGSRLTRPKVGRLHVITDMVLQTRFSHAELARLAIDGGADTVQYREKRPLGTRDLIETAAAVAGICRDRSAVCIVDDRADVAFGANADGIHVGRDDLGADAARGLLGDGFLIGCTANSPEQARAAFRLPVDYLGVGPVFGTRSKANPALTLGLDALREIAGESPVPVIAIGSIAPERVAEVLGAGAYGIAVLSGVSCSVDPAAAAALYAESIERFVAGAVRKG
jgi:thiamine-phosphate pyrophosphorylase